MAMKKEHLDLLTITAIAAILFGGFHLLGNKRIDPESARLAAMGPAAGGVR